MDETTWRRRTGPALLAASIAFLLAYSWRVITAADGPAALVANIVIIVTWAAFVVDYLVRLAIAPRKWPWFRRHLPDLAITLIPVLRLVRVAKILTRLPGRRRTHAAALRTRIMVYGLASTAILIYIASLQVLDAERHADGATIISFGDALWWACVTATTTGFGDLTPVTTTGKLVGVVLMFGGVALAGIITATLASWVVERGARGDDAAATATRSDIHALQAEIAALRSSLESGESEGGDDRTVS
ncbi:potassium channel family protein [Microbacterium sp. H1-D42]|uniref:potassium channel family protein n=1 Tax=Microbacterium sp. H1-D42 TaxID=2925844 RepID=UPI001F5366F7|nr:potassium channel family protein [Microbacterium sp. H1-D42]UNK71105.1 potassium channel family protein [Microbacterium sp. H1-D42]